MTRTHKRNVRVPVTEERLRYIVAHMRQKDHEEIFSLRWDDNPEPLIRETMFLAGDMCWIWERDGVPVSIQGVICLRPGVWEGIAFGTDCWPLVVLDMTRHARRFIKPALLRAKAHRVECRALASHTESRKWIEALGGKQEAILSRYTRDTQDFVLYAWRAEDHV